MAAEKTEKIGGVTLDYTYYPGEDYYCDGDVEESLLEIVQNHPREEYEDIIRQKKDWPILYHLSGVRGNIVDWIPFTGKEKVLEIGAGPGAITGTLAAKCAEVTCVELSMRRSKINAYRHRDCSNITIMVGNFEDIEPHLPCDYDYIFLIGVFEYAGSYIHGAKDPFAAELLKIKPHLKGAGAPVPSSAAESAQKKDAEGAAPQTSAGERAADAAAQSEGRLVIAIENRLGLKYWAGCREDHSGRYFDGIESYQNGPVPAVTFSKPALEQYIRGAGFTAYQFYYPYPDYKFMEMLYSDRRPPDASELSMNIRNFDRDRLLLFNERKAYEGITRDGLYPTFSNSFLVMTGDPLPVVYARFSDDRAPQYRIRTEILEETAEDGERSRCVTKAPVGAGAIAHVAGMAESYEKLRARYEETEKSSLMQPSEGAEEGSAAAPADTAEKTETAEHTEQGEKAQSNPLRIAPCRYDAQRQEVVFPFVKGVSLEKLLDERLSAGDGEGFKALLLEYEKKVGANADAGISDADMTFPNILVDGDKWTAIDYEWAQDAPISGKDLLFRSLLVYYLADDRRREMAEKLIGNDRLLSDLGISEESAEKLTGEEKAFQEKVTGNETSLGELRAKLGRKVIKPAELQTEAEKEAALVKEQKSGSMPLSTVQVYLDTGKGYNEDESYFVPKAYGSEGLITFTVHIPAEARRLRIDPALCPCICLIREAAYGGAGTATLQETAKSNGKKLGRGQFIFTDADPRVEWDLRRFGRLRRKAGESAREGADLTITLQMAGLPSTMAAQLRG